MWRASERVGQMQLWNEVSLVHPGQAARRFYFNWDNDLLEKYNDDYGFIVDEDGRVATVIVHKGITKQY